MKNMYKKAEIINRVILCPDLGMDHSVKKLVREALEKIPAMGLRQCYVTCNAPSFRTCKGFRTFPSIRYLPLVALDLFPDYFDETTTDLILTSYKNSNDRCFFSIPTMKPTMN